MSAPSVNNIYAALTPANTGIGQAQFDPKLIKGVLIVPKGYALTAAQVATLQTKLQNDAMNDSKSSRIYPINFFVETKDGSENAVEQSFAYGAKVIVRDGFYTWSFQWIQGGKTLSDALRTFNGANWNIFLVDANDVLLGTINPADPLGIASIPLVQMYTVPFKLNDGKKIAEYSVQFTFDPKYLNELGAVIANAGFSILDTITGLQNAALSMTTALTKVFNVTVQTPQGLNLGGQYGSVSGLAQAALWTATDTAGAALTVSAVAYNASTQTFTVTLASTNYVVGHTILINLVGPTELATGGVPGFESLGAASAVGL